MKLEISKIKVGRGNFRKTFDVKDLQENMEDRGQIEPIIITPDNKLIAGERRLRAAKALGWKTIEVSVKKYKVKGEALDREIKVDGIFENIKRSSYTKSEEAKALAWLKKNQTTAGIIATAKDRGPTKKATTKKTTTKKKSFAAEVAKKTGQSAATINTKAKLGELMSAKVSKALDTGEISQRQAELLIRAPTKSGQDDLLEKVQGTKLTETREIIEAVLSGKSTGKKKIQGIEANAWIKRVYEKMESVLEDVNHAFDVQAWIIAEEDGKYFSGKVVKFLKGAANVKKAYVKAQPHKFKRNRATRSTAAALH